MEQLYHYIWQHRMLGRRFTCRGGESVEIVHPGVHNSDSGPDFSGARIRIGDQEWCGDVEIHVKASDWKRHGHHTDPAYDTVILHVVAVDDSSVCRTDGSEINTVCLTPPAGFYQQYQYLTSDMDAPGCLPHLSRIPPLNLSDWICSMGIERLHEKAGYIRGLLETTAGDFRQTLFIVIARALGFGLNGVPFELLAKSLPLNFAMRHRDNPFQIEALIFGQAGMLDAREYSYDSYYQSLCREYEFLAHKYGLKPIDPKLWKYARTRPQNFPHRRLSILASMVSDGLKMASELPDAKEDFGRIAEMFRYEASDYWRTHSRFGCQESQRQLPVGLSDRSIEILAINVAAPYYMALAATEGRPELGELAIRLLSSLKPESNSQVDVWASGGVKPANAFESQALLHLRRNYCSRARCMECRAGHYILRKAINGERC